MPKDPGSKPGGGKNLYMLTLEFQCIFYILGRIAWVGRERNHRFYVQQTGGREREREGGKREREGQERERKNKDKEGNELRVT